MAKITSLELNSRQQDRKTRIEALVQVGLQHLKSVEGVVDTSTMRRFLTSHALTKWWVEERKAREYADIALQLILEEAEKAENAGKARVPATPPRST